MPFYRMQFAESMNTIIESPAWRDDAVLKLYLYCLARASHNTYKWHGRILEPGDLPLSERHVAEILNWSRAKLRRKICQLKELGLVNVVVYPQSGTLVKISNWAHNETTGFTTGTNIEPQADFDRNDSGLWYQNESTTKAENLYQDQYWYQSKTATGITARPNPNIDNNKYLSIESSVEPEGFKQIWVAYPPHRRNKRKEAAQLVAAALAEGATVQSILDALSVDKNSLNWLKNDGQYVPGIVKWLERESWRNYVKPQEPLEDENTWITR